MKMLLAALLLFVAGFPQTGLSQTAGPARKKLESFGIEFCQESFLKCAKKGNLEAVRLFVEAGIDVNAKDSNGKTALMKAAREGYAEIVDVLLQAGADVNATTSHEGTALMKAARWGRAGIVKTLLAAGADVNVRDSSGLTALIWASSEGHTEIVKSLLEAKADVQAMDSSGKTALTWAREKGHRAVIDLLAAASAQNEVRVVFLHNGIEYPSALLAKTDDDPALPGALREGAQAGDSIGYRRYEGKNIIEDISGSVSDDGQVIFSNGMAFSAQNKTIFGIFEKLKAIEIMLHSPNVGYQ